MPLFFLSHTPEFKRPSPVAGKRREGFPGKHPPRVARGRVLFIGTCLLLSGLCVSHAWESALFPVDRPLPTGNFETDAFLQDFSMAGYHGGDTLPEIAGPVRDVTAAPYNADPTGASDSTVAIQAAITATENAGGGVVYLPAGTYRVSPQDANAYALRIQKSGVVLRGAGRGKTFIFNSSTSMRSKSILLVQGPVSVALTHAGAGSSPITADLLTPTTEIPVASVAIFSVGSWVTVRTDTTDAWVSEHQEPEWLGQGAALGGLAYRRKVVAISGNRVILDAPTRYSVKVRDNARLVLNATADVSEVGIEDFSIGNAQISGSSWQENAYNDSKDPAYNVHDSWVVKLFQVRNCWVQRVASYQPAGNSTTTHILSNGIYLNSVHRVTVRDCQLQRSQYGGGGGNGYLFRFSRSSDNLIEQCSATFTRHGFVFANMQTSGNVIYRCVDKDTGKAVGSSPGGYSAGGRGSDHHMHFSHSNLIDTCTVDGSFFTAKYRASGSVPRHLLSAAHSVFWNIEGIGSTANGNFAVETEQARYGYAIGTRGTRISVSRPTSGGARMDPPDWVEGTDQGNTLEPFSLYERQLRRKRHQVSLRTAEGIQFPQTSLKVRPDLSASAPEDADSWTLVSGPGTITTRTAGDGSTQVFFSLPGTYVLRLNALRSGVSSQSDTTVQVQASGTNRTLVIPTAEDTYVYDGGATQNYGAAGSLAIKGQGGSGYQREILQKFDLSPLVGKTIDSAFWEATAKPLAAPAGNWSLRAYLTGNSNWTETGVTWNNAPAVAPSSYANISLDGSGFGRFNATALANTALRSGTILSLRIRDMEKTESNLLYFPSRETGSPGVAALIATISTASDHFTHWASARLPVNQRGPMDDPDADGLSNLVEYLTGSDPMQSTPAAPLQIGQTQDSQFIISFPLSRELGPGAWVVIEHTESLREAWQPLPVPLAQQTLDAQRDLFVAQMPMKPAPSAHFFRLRASLD